MTFNVKKTYFYIKDIYFMFYKYFTNKKSLCREIVSGWIKDKHVHREASLLKINVNTAYCEHNFNLKLMICIDWSKVSWRRINQIFLTFFFLINQGSKMWPIKKLKWNKNPFHLSEAQIETDCQQNIYSYEHFIIVTVTIFVECTAVV